MDDDFDEEDITYALIEFFDGHKGRVFTIRQIAEQMKLPQQVVLPHLGLLRNEGFIDVLFDRRQGCLFHSTITGITVNTMFTND